MRIFVLLFAVTACTGPPAREALVLRIAVWGPLGQLAPSSDESSLASIAQPWVFDRLFTVDTEGQLVPNFVTRFERLAGDRIRVELRRDRTFSDGTAVSDGDVVRSLESAGIGVTLDAGTLILESRTHGLPIDALLLNALIYREVQGQAIGSGPFMLASQGENELRLTRRTPQPGRINEVRVIAYKDSREAFTRTLKGDANFIVDLESRWLEFFTGVPSLHVLRGTGRSTDAIAFNPSLSRRDRLRLAAVLGSNRIRDLAYGSDECAESKAHGTDDGSLPEGNPLRVLSWGPFERLALAARRSLADRAGEISHVPPQEVLSRFKSRDFDLVTVRPLRWPPSTMALVWRTGAPYNFVGYSNAAVDRAVDAHDWTAAEAALREDPPAALICTHDHLAVADVRIKNAVLGPFHLLETLPDWEVQ